MTDYLGTEIASEAASTQPVEGLHRGLSQRQLTMMAIGGAIGVGLFLGSSVTIRLAGPAVTISYLLDAGIALIMSYALAEMAVVHPVAGAFGIHAETYLSRWAGFSVRATYSAAQIIAIGAEVTAVGLYFGYWFPVVPQWTWVVAASVFALSIPPTINNRIFVPWDLTFGSGMQTLGSLVATVESAVQIQPDVLVIFVGNNWNLLETPEVSPYAPSVAARQRFAEAWREGGSAGPVALAAGRLRAIVEAAFERIALIARAIGVPVVVVVPEVSLGGREVLAVDLGQAQADADVVAVEPAA